MNALQLNQSIRAKLNEYNNRIRDMNRLHERLNREYPRQYTKLSSCLELVKEYCESSGAVAVEDEGSAALAVDEVEDAVDEVEDAGAAALAVDEVEDAGAAAARVGTVSEKIVECLTQFETELRPAIKDDFTENLKKLISESGKIKKIESLILSHILPCVTGEGLVSKEQAFKMLHGKKNFTILGQNYKRSSLLKKCSLRLVRQGGLGSLSESCKIFLSISFLWNGNPLELPDIVADARAASAASAASSAAAAAAKQPPPIRKVFIKTKSNRVPSFTKQTRLVTIDKDGFQWFDTDSDLQRGSIPLGQIVRASDGGTWGKLFGVDIEHPGVQGQGDNTYLWCETDKERDDVIATVNALVELKNGGNKNRKTIIKYRKRRHQNKKKTHKKNANKKSTKKNIRKSKTKKK
jgi:hypothetical protein